MSTVTFTPDALSFLKQAATEDKIPMFRMAVTGGGCSGLEYGVWAEAQQEPEDHIEVHDGLTIVMDRLSQQHLEGASITAVQDDMGMHLRIDNPNATSSCGCGKSFQPADGEAASGCGGCG